MSDETKTVNPDAGYLPVLPDGWKYAVVVLTSDDREAVSITPAPTPEEAHRYQIATVTPDGLTRTHVAPSLREAVKTAVSGVRALDVIEREEARIREARQEALLSLGEVTAEPDDAIAV